VKIGLEERIEKLQEDLTSRTLKELQSGLERCDAKINETQKKILESLEEMKIVLVKEKFMTKV